MGRAIFRREPLDNFAVQRTGGLALLALRPMTATVRTLPMEYLSLFRNKQRGLTPLLSGVGRLLCQCGSFSMWFTVVSSVGSLC